MSLGHDIQVKELIEILQKLDPELWVTPNRVANLLISREAPDGFLDGIGYIDLLEGIPEDERIQMFGER